MDPHKPEAKAATLAIQNFYGSVVSIEHRKIFRKIENEKRNDSQQVARHELVPAELCETEAVV